MESASELAAGSPAPWLEIVVPARNEAGRLPAGLAALCAKAATLPDGVAIIVVDNGSTDATAEIVRQWPAGPVPVRLMSCDQPGKGAAVRAGLLATQAPYVGFCDADMATDPAAFDIALSELAAGRHAVIGSRVHAKSVVLSPQSIVRRVGGVTFNRVARTVARGVHDTQCGFKFFSGPVVRLAAKDLTTVGFAFDVELLARCRRIGGQTAVEIPVTWRDVPGSKFSGRRQAAGIFWDVVRIGRTLRRERRHRPRDERGGLANARVAVVNWKDPWHPEAGGAERYAWEMATGVRRRGATVRFVTARGAGQARRDFRDGVDVVRMGGRYSVYPRVLAWLAARRWSFDAVIDCQNGIPFFTPWVMPRRTEILCVIHHVHDAQFGVYFPRPIAAIGRMLEGPVSRWSYNRCRCVAVSDSTVAALRSRLGWTGPIDVIPNGLSPDSFLPAGTDAGSAPLIAFGRLAPHKRVNRVLDVADRLRGTGLTIDIIGSGPLAAPLAREIAARQLQDVVRLRGFLAPDEKRAALAAAALNLNASQGEGWGMCVLEAAAVGVPTVAYDVDGLRDAVRDGETGWLVKVEERIEDVTERAIKELSDPIRRAEIQRACRSWAERFDWDHSAQLMADLLGSGLRNRARDQRRTAWMARRTKAR